jgi:hypothetical protein
MSLLWVNANFLDPEQQSEMQVWHDEDQTAHRNINEALQLSGLKFHPHHVAPFATNPFGAACPNDGKCLAGHSVPQEGGYNIDFPHRNGRVEPVVTHECSEGEIHDVDHNAQSFGHPVCGMSALKTPQDVLSGHIKDYVGSQGVTDAIMAHHRQFHRR